MIQTGEWYRTCQECGHEQRAKQPAQGELTNSYANSKCRKCGSMALDYGKIKTDDTEDWTQP